MWRQQNNDEIFGTQDVGIIAEDCVGVLLPFIDDYDGHYLRAYCTVIPVGIFVEESGEVTGTSDDDVIGFFLYVDGIETGYYYYSIDGEDLVVPGFNSVAIHSISHNRRGRLHF